MWPTPRAKESGDYQYSQGNHNKKVPTLTGAVKMWPTPQASDNRDRGNLSNPAIQRRVAQGKQVNLSMTVSEQSGQLNPDWVECLMGFPANWTNIDGPQH
jgi:DNA (cytosine-5)-methyltransferase 1